MVARAAIEGVGMSRHVRSGVAYLHKDLDGGEPMEAWTVAGQLVW
jgi:hypothetical protein